MHRPIKGFEEPGGWARARRWCAVVALLGGAALCVLTLTPPPRGELVSAGAVVRLLGAAVGLAGAAALLAAASPPRPVYERLPTTVRPVRPGRLALRCVTALSLLLCIGSAVLCVRSYWGSDYLSRRVPLGAHASVITSRIHRITWTRGIIRLAVVDQRVNILGDVGPTPSPEPVPVWGWGRLGRGHAGSDRPAGASFWNQLGFYAYQTASAASLTVSSTIRSRASRSRAAGGSACEAPPAAPSPRSSASAWALTRGRLPLWT